MVSLSICIKVDNDSTHVLIFLVLGPGLAAEPLGRDLFRAAEAKTTPFGFVAGVTGFDASELPGEDGSTKGDGAVTGTSVDTADGDLRDSSVLGAGIASITGATGGDEGILAAGCFGVYFNLTMSDGFVLLRGVAGAGELIGDDSSDDDMLIEGWKVF